MWPARLAIAAIVCISLADFAAADDRYIDANITSSDKSFQPVFRWQLTTGGKTYKFSGLVLADSTATEGFDIRFAGSAVPSRFVVVVPGLGRLTSFPVKGQIISNASAGSKLNLQIAGTIKVATGGTFVMQFANHSDADGSSSILAGSIMSLEEVVP